MKKVLILFILVVSAFMDVFVIGNLIVAFFGNRKCDAFLKKTSER